MVTKFINSLTEKKDEAIIDFSEKSIEKDNPPNTFELAEPKHT